MDDVLPGSDLISGCILGCAMTVPMVAMKCFWTSKKLVHFKVVLPINIKNERNFQRFPKILKKFIRIQETQQIILL